MLLSPRTLTQPSDATRLYLVKQAGGGGGGGGGEPYGLAGKTNRAYKWKGVL